MDIYVVPDRSGTGDPGAPGAIGTEDILSVYTPILGTNTQVLPAVFQKLTGIFSTNGFSDGGTPDAANDRIIISTPGTWRVAYFISSQSSAGAVFFAHLRINGVEVPQVQSQETTVAFSKTQAAKGTVVLAAADVLEIYGGTNSGATVTYQAAGLMAKRLA